MLRKLLSGLRSATIEALPEAFLDRLLALEAETYPAPDPSTPFTPTLARRLWQAEREGRAPPPEDLAAFEQLRRRALDEQPAADRLALRWLCDVPGRAAWEQARRQAEGYAAGRQFLELEESLGLWVQRHPAPDAADAVRDALEQYRASLALTPQQPLPYGLLPHSSRKDLM